MDIDAAFERAQRMARTGDKAEALKLYHQMVREKPNEPEVLRRYCEILSENDVPAAERVARHLCSIDPTHGAGWGLLAGCLAWRGEVEEAGAMYEKALRLAPDMPTWRWNYALNLLMRGEWEKGWEEYKWGVVGKFLRTRNLKPEWEGAPIPGKTLFLWAEQGHGDAIMMVRYIDAIRKQSQCGRVVLEVHEALVSLFSDNGLADEVYSMRMDGSTPWEWDEHASLMSLPRLWPIKYPLSPASYITSPPIRLPGNGMRVGVCTKGNPDHANDRNRSTSFDLWTDVLMTAGCAFYNLDKTTSSLPMADFSQTAAIIADMDLIVTVDTAVAHLAAAMGKETWILLPKAGDWRWGYRGEKSVWYTSARLFRQEVHGEWGDVFEAVQEALNTRLEAKEEWREIKTVMRVGWEASSPVYDDLIPFDDFRKAVDLIKRAGTTRHAQLIYGLVRWLRPDVCVEVGTWHGYTAMWMARALQENGTGEVFCMDDFSLGVGAVSLEQLQENIESCGTGARMAILPGKSTDVEWPEHVDFAYIDGDHSYEGCKRDVDKAIEQGATCIAVHDSAAWWGVREWAEEFRDKGWFKMEVGFDEGLTVLLKKQDKPKVTYSKADFPTGCF